MLKNNIVTKANDLNLRAYKLNKTEQLLVLSIASMIQPQDEDFKTYKLYVKDFMDLIDVSDKSKYIELPKITKSLMMKIIEIKKAHSLLQVAWFSSVEHRPGEGLIEVEFSPKLKPYLLNLKENFVTYALNQVAKLSSKYSIRFYELLKQYQFMNIVQFELDEFRGLIGLDDSIYPRYSNMKPKVLLVAQKEINNKTDIFFDFEEIKSGRKVTTLKFYIKVNNKAKKSVTRLQSAATEISATLTSDLQKEDPIKKIMALMCESKITKLEAKKLSDTANGDIYKIEEKYALAQKAVKIDSIVGWMLRAIKDDYQVPKGKIKTGGFNDYEQRTYDVDALEKELLGWDNNQTDEAGEEYQQSTFKQNTRT